MNRHKHSSRSTRRRGFTLVECLIGLAISAILLTAMAAAFNASVTNYRENEDMYWTMNNARQALARMTSQIRTAGYFDTSTNPVTAYGVSLWDPNNQCTFYTPEFELFRYDFRSADSKLYLVKLATNQEYVLCDNVVAATFTRTPTEDGTTSAKNVQISLTVQEGDFRRTLAAAAVVRKFLNW